MPRFVFHLQSVFRQRHRAERQRQHELAQALLRCQALQRQMRDLGAEIQGGMAELRERTLGGVVDVRYVLAQSGVLTGLRCREEELARELALAEVRAAEARQLLTRDAQGRRIMEKLRDKQYDRWRSETARRQAIADDDVAARWAAP